MITKDAELGINLCLDNAKRLIDDAEFLARGERYQSSIPLYVLAYEEIGKAVFLWTKLIDNKRVDEKEFSTYNTGGSAHVIKLLEDNNDVIRTLKTMSDKQFENTKKQTEAAGLRWWKQDRKSALKAAREDRDFLPERLHDLKMALLYTDYSLGKWIIQKNYPKNALSAICLFVHTDALRAYYRMRANSLLYSMGIRRRHQPLNAQQRKQFYSNNDILELIGIIQDLDSERYVKARKIAIPEIKAIINVVRTFQEERKSL